ncbi:Nucleoside-diphosphate kinase [Apodemus speciosus]|uniref:Nucleoside-diphosphate kinase n=1 Tax=Apodemus speciosus TaxID=105296 RepID=A0ABQ0FPT5_APOSI
MVTDNLLSYPNCRGFLVDGFPRVLEQAKEFERIVSDLRPRARAPFGECAT